ncbi:Ig-like domain-containing protein [Yersinia enterocolitica]|uniref:Ig-like domain-containing protein n=1 Tax=Yersinia enterocolitica TaxID=630 RepID=UPI001C8DC56F|nr:Ig-like domain-containing protein [Yersinia enterocolitica]MBX9495841.1 Ig-like domain-containing protein [Yersinia enterocolitica]
MSSIFKGIGRYLGSGFLKKTIAYAQIFLQILLSTLPLYSMSFSTQANSDITKKTVLFKRLYTLTPTDTLESVASNYGLSVDELWALNINLYNNRSAFDAVKYGAVVYIPNQEEEQQATQQASMVASHLSQVGNSLSSEDRVGAFSRLAKGMLLSSTAKTVEEWLGHIGQAQVKLQADDKNDFSGSEVDLFIPLYDQPEKLAFSQFGFRRIDQRNIMNIGLGQRHYISDWMFGYNIFFDQQISGNAHRRVGFGGELARDYVKLSANSYHRLGGWKNSTRLEDYDERAANGYDIRTEAYLPHYPQLGGKLMYEQYFGDEVALFGINERQKNPSALTAGISYTPIPLVSLGLDHTFGNGGKNKTGMNVAVNYEINTPWQQQIDPAAVQGTRTLAGSRMDLVDRNNNIVLEYRKQQVVTLNLPEKVSGKEKQVVPINYTFNARHGLDRIEWDAADVIKAGGQVSSVGNLAYHVAMPPYIDGGDNAYVLSGRAVDKKGNYSVSSSTNIYVTGVNINRINSVLSLTPATLPANRTSRSVLHLKLNTDAGQAVSGASGQMSFVVRDVSGNVPRVRSMPQPVVISEAQEIDHGIYEASVTSGSLVGRFEITPIVRGVQLNPLILTQAADATTAMIHSSGSVTISTPSITTNTADKTRLEVQVTDALGHPVPGVEVTWVSDLNSPGLEHVTSITNEHGIAENNFSSNVAGTANITVQVGTSTPVAAGAIEIKADNSTMTVKASDFTVTTTSVVANGTDKTVYKLKVTDKQGNAVPAAAVEWSNNIGTFVQGSATTTTNADGETFIELVSIKAGTAKVTATVGGKPYNAGEVVFVADRQSAQIALLPASKIKAAANDKDWITLTAKIVDAHNNPIKSEKIVWDAVSHQMTFSPTTKITHTNDQGESEIQVASAQVGDASVSAKVGANDLLISQANQTLTFSADAASASISKWLAPTATTLIADGVKTISYTVLVEDDNHHPVANSEVLWETDLGKFTSSQTMKTVTTTDSQGEATVELASTQAGFAKVKAAVNGVSITSTAKVEFTADSSTATIAITPVNKQVYVANGSEKVTYAVTVLDANNNPVKAEAISWKAENGHPVKIEPASSQTDEQGKATVNIGSVKAGKTQIRATLGNAATAIADAITFNADRQTAKIESVVVTSSKVTAPDGSSTISYVTTVEDINSNPVSGMILSWGSNINKVTNPITTTDANGMSTQTITGTQAGKLDVSVALNEGTNAKDPVKSINEAEFVAVTPVNANSSLLLLPNLIIADGKQNATLKFTLRDANHNPVSGLANQIKVTQATANNVTVAVDAIAETTVKGVYEAEIKGTKEGTVDLTATVTGRNVSKTQKLTLQADNKTATLKTVTSNIKTAKADGMDGITYTATVIDAQGNASLANVSVGWRTNLGELVAMSKTNASGMATVTLTSKQAGKATVTAIVSSSSQMDALPVTFTAGGIVIAQSSASVSAANLVADSTTTTLTVKVNDTNGNPLTGQSGKIKVTAANFPGLALPTQFTEGPNGVYTATISGTKAGEGEIVTTLDGAELAKQTLKVIADVRTAKIAEVKPLQSGSIAVGDKVTYQATIKDANDNLLGKDIPVHWSVNRDTLMSGKLISLTNSAGVAEMEISRDVQGDALVTAMVNNHSLQATAVNFSSGGVDIKVSSVAVVQGNNIIANNLDVATIQVDIRDSKGNPLPNLAGQITTSPTHGYKKLEIETKANSLGGYLVTIKGTQAGKYPVTISVNGNPLPDTANVELVGDRTTAQLLSVDVNKTTFKANDVDQVIYTAKVIDKHDNPLGNYQVAWNLAQGAGTYDVQSYTNKMGIAETSLKANRLGEYKMDVWVRGNKSSAPSVNSIAGDVDPGRSDFVVNVPKIGASGDPEAKLTATLKDKFGNLLKGQKVNVKNSSSLKGIKFSANPMTDNGDGTYSTEVSATQKGDTKFIASINGIDLKQQPQLLVGNIIPQLSFANQNVTTVYSSKKLQPQQLKSSLLGTIATHWSSDNSDVAKFNANGEIELLKAGIVTITAETQADNTYARGVASYQLEVERADPKLAFAKRISSTTWGQTVTKEQPNVGHSDWVSSQPQLKWSSSALDVAKVDSSGNITLLKAGDTLIKATTEQTDQFKASEAEYVLNINKANLVLNFSQSLKQYSVDSQPSNVQSLNLPSDLPTRAVRWSSSNPGVMNIDPYGRINRVSAGETDIKIEIDKNDFYLENSAKYLAEVYKKPSISISSTNIVSKGISSPNSSEWKPAFKGDQMVVNWRVSGSGKFEGPQKVVVQFIEENSGNKLFEKESTSNLASGSTTIEDIRVKNLVGRRGRFVVKTEGISGLSSQEKTKVIDVKRLYPDEIWNKVRFRSGHSIYHKGKSVKDCRTSKLPWNEEHHVNLNWDVGIDLGNNELIEGMEVKLRIDKVKNTYISPRVIAIRNILKTFNEENKPGSSGVPETLHTDCFDPHNDVVGLVLDVDYLGKTTMYNAGEVYWEGLGRTNKNFVEAKVERK